MRFWIAFMLVLTGWITPVASAIAAPSDLAPVGPLAARSAPAGSAQPTGGRVTDIASPEALMQALQQATGGETLRLAPGNYGALALSPATPLPPRFARPVTLVSADPDRPARFTGITLIRVGNLVLDRLYIDHTFSPGDKMWDGSVMLREVSGVEIRNSVLDGDVARGMTENDNGFGFQMAIVIRDSQDVTIANNSIFRFAVGVQSARNRNLTIRSNDIFDLRIDGMQIIDSQKVLIEGNYIHDFRAPATIWDHRDMIQFWTARTKTPSRDITIRGNVLFAGAGDFTQTIFMGNEEVAHNGAGPEMYYRNILIEDNLIANAHFHGISLGAADGLTIRRNTLVRNPAAQGVEDNPALWSPGIRLEPKSLNVTVEDNITGAVGGAKGQRGWRIQNNLIIQDHRPNAIGWYDDVFRSARTGDPTDLASYGYVPSSPADRGAYGTALLNSARIGPMLAALPDGGRSGRPAHGAVAAASALPDDTGTLRLLLALDGRATAGHGAGTAGDPRSDGTGIVLGGGGPSVLVEAPDLQMMESARALDITFSFRSGTTVQSAATPAGRLLSLPGVIEISLTQTGMLQVVVAQRGLAPLQLRTAPLRLHDGAWHDVRLHYRPEGAVLHIDGEIRARAAHKDRPKASLPPLKPPVLILGPSGEGKSFDGWIRQLSVTANPQEIAE